MPHSHLNYVYHRQGLYLQFCVSRILPGGVIFPLDITKYTCIQNISAHSVTESKTHNLVIVLVLLHRHNIYCHTTFARTDNAPCRKTGEFSLDLSEMRPVRVTTSIMWHLKRPLRYGRYLSNQIQQNNFEMCKVKKGNALQSVKRNSFRPLCSRIIWHDI